MELSEKNNKIKIFTLQYNLEHHQWGLGGDYFIDFLIDLFCYVKFYLFYQINSFNYKLYYRIDEKKYDGGAAS